MMPFGLGPDVVMTCFKDATFTVTFNPIYKLQRKSKGLNKVRMSARVVVSSRKSLAEKRLVYAVRSKSRDVERVDSAS